jgi:pimeloyl-ACP methyl ester carboxylesterase
MALQKEMGLETAPRLVDVGGRWIAVQRKGSGPLVVLEASGGSPGIGRGWAGVDERIAEFASVITYDRAGVGLSPAPGTYLDIGGGTSMPNERKQFPTVADRVSDLSGLLDVVAPSQRVILAGWSLGGLIAEHFAAVNPDRIAGLLLIDPMPVDSYEGLPAWQSWLVDTQLPTRMFRRLARSGLLKARWMQAKLKALLATQFGPKFDRDKFLPMVVATMADPRLHEALLLETRRLRESVAETAAILKKHPLPNVPLIGGCPKRMHSWSQRAQKVSCAHCRTSVITCRSKTRTPSSRRSAT